MNASYKLTYLFGGIESSRMLLGAIQVLYLLSTGVSLSNLALIKIVYCISTLIADVPIGFLANRYGNKKSVIIGCLFVSAYYPLILHAPNMGYLLSGEIIYGIGLCCLSGALDAWTANAVKAEYDDKNKINFFFHFRNELMSLGSMVMSPLGAVILSMSGSIKYVYALASVLIFLIGISALTINSFDSVQVTKNISIVTKISYYELRSKKIILYILLITLITVIYQPIFHFWQPLFINLFSSSNNIKLATDNIQQYSCCLGAIFFCYSLCIYLMNHYVRNFIFKKISSEYLGIMVITFATLCILFLAFCKYSLPCVIAFSLCHGLLSLFMTLVESCFVNSYSGSCLTIIISIANVSSRIVSSFFLYLLSYFAQSSGLNLVFFLGACVCLCTAVIFMINFKKYNGSNL